MKNHKSFHQEFGTECMRVYRPNSDNFYSWTMLLQWNPGSIQINGKSPIRFNGARISCVSVFFHSSLIFVSQLSGRLLSVQVKIKAFYSYVSGLLSVFSPKEKKGWKSVRHTCSAASFTSLLTVQRIVLLHLLAGQNFKKKAKCCLCVIPNSKAFKELLFSALHVLSFGYGCHGI